jgi:hypothetical protein
VENTLLALDGKIDFDDNALYRHEDIIELRDTSQEDGVACNHSIGLEGLTHFNHKYSCISKHTAADYNE